MRVFQIVRFMPRVAPSCAPVCKASVALTLCTVLTACGGGGSDPPPPPPAPTPTATLTANPTTVSPSGMVTLTWSSTDAVSCTSSNGWTGPRATAGTAQVGPIAATTTFTLTCGTATANATVTVSAPPATVTLTANPTTVAPGGMSTLTWSSANAASCTASNGWTGARAASGTEQVGPHVAATTYTLTCGTATANAAVTLAPAAVTFTLSGQLSAPATTRTDSDTNDIILTPISNNTAAQAQSLPNPVVLGGYLNNAGKGEPGPAFQGGDGSDYYRVNLLQGQVVELAIASLDPEADDLDLELRTVNDVIVASSLGVGATERVTLAAPNPSGQYLVRVVAYQLATNGASNYVLTIGQTGTTSFFSERTLDAPFVPGEVLVKGRAPEPQGVADGAMKQAAIDSARDTMQATLAGNYGFMLEKSAPGMHSRLRLTPNTVQSLELDESGPPRFATPELATKWQTLMALKQLNAMSNVEWAEPNWIMEPHAAPNDPLYAKQRWHYEQMSLPAAWDVTQGSSNVIVAVLDTGVRPHAQFNGRLVAGYDFANAAISGDGDGDDSDTRDPGKPVQGGYSFHGTHVAGTIGAIGNDALGGTGVAWNVRIMPVRVLGTLGGSSEDVLQGMLFAAGLPNRSGFIPAQKADVINMSLGGVGMCSASFQDALDRVRAEGVIVVASAGNDATSGAYQPAGCAGVVSVSALGPDRTAGPYSNFGLNVDVAAPGGDLRLDRNGDGEGDGVYSTYSQFDGTAYFSTYAPLQGTSMAAPHVAGVAALMKSVGTVSPTQFDTLLASGVLTDDILTPGPDALGVGLLNANKAVRALSINPPATPQLSVQPTTLNFGDAVTTNDVAVTNSGTAALALTGTVTSAPWLTVSPTAVDASGLGTYRITVNRAGLAVGTYNGFVEFGSVPGNQRVAVIMQVASAPQQFDAGQHYLLLLDPDTFATKYQVEAYVRGPVTDFTFQGVPAGEYVLAAGTDNDNDGSICDDGEACGEYPLFGENVIINVTANRTGLDFVTAYRNNLRVLTAAGESENLPVQSPALGFRRLR